jgi:6-pyruvoyl-tetrahydropterin synthase
VKCFFIVVFLTAISACSFKNLETKSPSSLSSPENESFLQTKNAFIDKFDDRILIIKKAHKYYDTKALKLALNFLDKNKDSLQKKGLCLSKNNTQCLVVADYTLPKNKKRLLVYNLKDKSSELFYTAHGKGSNEPDKRETGLMPVRFSNTNGSNMTSLGFYLTDQLYNSQKDTFGPGPRNGLRMDGLNCTNNKAKGRYIVMHTAQYVPPKNTDGSGVGNSEGCITLPKLRKDILEMCKGGALVYAHGE